MTATIHLMHGFIGFGKTTIAKQLANDLPAARLTNDEFMENLYGRNPPAELFRDYYNRIDNLIWNLAEQIIKTGADVIIDHGFWSKESRKSAYEKARKITDKIVFHNVVCDMKTARECVLERTKNNPDKLTVDERAFDLFLPQFEPMTPDEDYTTVNHDNNIKDWKCAAYIIPVRETDGGKQAAFAVWNSGWHGCIGGRLDNNETPREAVRREIAEECGKSAAVLADNAIEIAEKLRTPIRDVIFRRARNEEHTFFIVKIPDAMELAYCEDDRCEIKWLDISALTDPKIIPFRDAREYNGRVIIPAIEALPTRF